MINMQKSIDVLNKIKANDNIFYSPVSINIALSYFLKIIEKDASYNEIKNFIEYNWLEFKPSSDCYKIVNTLWINKNKNFYLSNISDIELIEIDMTDSAKATDIKNRFVNEKTKGFITSTPTVFNKDTISDLMNIIYFKDAWRCGELQKTILPITFNNFDGTSKLIRMMIYKSSYYYENDTCYMVPVEYKSGLTFNLVYAKNNLEDVNLNNLRYVHNKANIKFPQFETNISFELTKYADALGIPNIKNSRLIFDTNGDSETSITHTARITVDPVGTEAAAVTEIYSIRGCMLRPQEPIELTFDKPFYYLIKDRDYVLFTGRLAKL